MVNKHLIVLVLITTLLSGIATATESKQSKYADSQVDFQDRFPSIE